jgi:hypothetical protein
VHEEPHATGQIYGDEIVMRRSWWKSALFVAAQALVGGLVFIATYGLPPSFRFTLYDVVTAGVLIPLSAFTGISLLGLFSPQPICTISHDGVQTYSLFGLFGTRLFPWSHIKAIVTYFVRGERWLKIYSDNSQPRGRRSLLQRLNGPDAAIIRVSVSGRMMAGSLDDLLDQISERFGAEIDAASVRLIDQGDDAKDYSPHNWEALERVP